MYLVPRNTDINKQTRLDTSTGLGCSLDFLVLYPEHWMLQKGSMLGNPLAESMIFNIPFLGLGTLLLLLFTEVCSKLVLWHSALSVRVVATGSFIWTFCRNEWTFHHKLYCRTVLKLITKDVAKKQNSTLQSSSRQWCSVLYLLLQQCFSLIQTLNLSITEFLNSTIYLRFECVSSIQWFSPPPLNRLLEWDRHLEGRHGLGNALCKKK